MNPEQWTAVDKYITDLLVPADDALDAALRESTAAGLPATAFSRIEIWPLMSDSDWAPSSGTLTPRSLPALRAPASTICQ